MMERLAMVVLAALMLLLAGLAQAAPVPRLQGGISIISLGGGIWTPGTSRPVLLVPGLRA